MDDGIGLGRKPFFLRPWLWLGVAVMVYGVFSMLLGGVTGSGGACVAMTAAEIETITQSNAVEGTAWTGDGDFTVTAAEKSRTSEPDTGFDEVGYLKVDAAGMDDQVFTFVVGGSFTSVRGLLMGADSVTRDFWKWGSAAAPISPAVQAAEAAVDASTKCL